MCLFIAIPTKDWYILWSQRDEQEKRLTSKEILFDINRDSYYTIDKEWWWTRFIHQTNNIYVVLLNHEPYFEKSIWLSSRWKLPLHCIDLYNNKWNIKDVIDQILKEWFHIYNSFILAIGIFDNKTKKLYHHIFTWNSIEKKLIQEEKTWKLFIKATTLYNKKIEETIAKELPEINDINKVKSFLDKYKYNSKSQYCINKLWVITKSRTIVQSINGENIYTFTTNL